MTLNNLAARYVQLELNIPYDNDDYDVWCSIYYDTQEHKIEKSRFGHGSPDVLWSNSVSLYDAIEVLPTNHRPSQNTPSISSILHTQANLTNISIQMSKNTVRDELYITDNNIYHKDYGRIQIQAL